MLVLVATFPLVAGFVLLGVRWRKERAISLRVALVAVGAVMATFPVMYLLVSHLPSGPLLTFHPIWVVLGYVLLSAGGVVAGRHSRVS